MGTRILDGSKSLVAPPSDYHMIDQSPPPCIFHYEPHPCRLPTARLPNQGYVNRLPGVATLLRRHDTIPSSKTFVSVRDPSYDFQRRSSSPTTNSTFDCWTPPSLTGRPRSIPSPAFKLVPLTTALNPTGEGRYVDWSSTLDHVVPKTTKQVLETRTHPAKTFSPVNWSPARVHIASNSRSKSSRYLREIDRRRILMRIAQGEKQSALAKEYHVSRAAICNLNKHRAEVLLRNHEHPLAKHPKRRTVTRPKGQDTTTTTTTTEEEEEEEVLGYNSSSQG